MALFWKIEEAVGSGRYIEHEGIFETRESCEHEILRRFGSALMGKIFRAQQYQTGRGSDGPKRV